MIVKTLFLVFISLNLVQAADAPMDKAALIAELDKIETMRKTQMTSGLSTIVDQLNAALGSPKETIELYEKAVFANRFEGGSRDDADFNKWKLQDAEKMKDPAFLSALQYHIEYLIYALKRIGGQEPESLLNEMNGYVQRYRQDEDTFSNDGAKDPAKPRPQGVQRDPKAYDDLLQHPVSEGPFAKYYQIEKQFDNLKDWELKAGNSRGIEDIIIFPLLRKKKDPSLVALWDQRIEYERKRTEKSGLNEDKSVFDNNLYPNLLWARSRDVILLGDEPGGIKALMGVLHTYPLNASFDSWMAEMRGILADKPVDPAPATPSSN